MAELIEFIGLAPLLDEAGVEEDRSDFEALYDTVAISGKYPGLAADIEARIYDYFAEMQLPDKPTIYDYLVLSLRGKDLIATFNWDPFLAQAYRRNSHVAKLPEIVFLHGNVEIGVCVQDKAKGWKRDKCDECKKPFPPTKLMYPVRQKDYDSDPFIRNEWNVVRRFLDRAYFLTIYGYAAPATDVEAKRLMLKPWKENRGFGLAQVNIIDTKPEAALRCTWDDFLCGGHCGVYDDIFESFLFQAPRRSCDALAMTTLHMEFWDWDQYPEVETLADLHEWLVPLLKEEEEGVFSGKTSQLR